MKAIATCTSNRPEYFRRFLESLSMNNLGGWTLYVSMDLDCPEIQSQIEGFKLIPVEAWRNESQQGPERNTFTVCNKAMEDGAEALLYTDDDMLLSPDAIDLCNWYLEQPQSKDPQNNGGLCLCTDASDPARPSSITPHDTWRGLVGQGYFYTREQWHHFVKPNFFYDDPKWEGHGYDWSLGYRSVELGKRILRPRFSRSQHIGVHGHHEGGRIFPEHYCKMNVGNFVIENE